MIKRLLADNVFRLRQLRRWSIDNLALEADLHHNYVGRIKRAEINIGIENLCRLAKAFNVEPGYLLEPDRTGLTGNVGVRVSSSDHKV